MALGIIGDSDSWSSNNGSFTVFLLETKGFYFFHSILMFICLQSTKSESVERLRSLSPQAQQLVGQIAEMGFPLSRVARAYTALGDNGKTVRFHFLLF